EQAKEVEEESETKMRTVKRKARVGERILITKAETPRGQYKNGDILTVSKAFGKLGSPHAIQADGVDIGIYHNEYEVIIEESTPKFKEGDRVKALANGQFGDVIEGEIGTIVDFIEDDVDSYNIEVKTADDYDYFRPQDLELIAEEENTKLEYGDYIVALPGAPYYITSSDMKLGKIVGNGLLAGDDITVKVIAHDDAFRVGNEYSVESKYFRKATDEEIAKFTKKPREFKKGDIVRVVGGHGHRKGTICEVITSDGSDSPYVSGMYDDVVMDLYSKVELIAPVESRVDVE